MFQKKVLVIGSGGREYVLAQMFSASSYLVHCYPGNAGCLAIRNCCLAAAASGSKEDLIDYARKNKIDLAVIGPEKELVEGYADDFIRARIPVFGPKRHEARGTEGSKYAAKQLMEAAGIPTAPYEVFTKEQLDSALSYATFHLLKVENPTVVIKADGLCGGKGVTVARTKEQAEAAIYGCLVRDQHGKAGHRILIEDFLVPAKGLVRAEFSIFILIGANNSYITMPPVMDYKQVEDGDKGPNGGGSGAITRPYFVTKKVQQQVEDRIIKPLLAEMKRQGMEYRGVLYLGLMLTDQGPYVVEFNCRFGDPEIQALSGIQRTGLASAMDAVANGQSLKGYGIDWSEQSSVYVVMMSKGYPGSVQKGHVISGLDVVARMGGVYVIHAGTAQGGQSIITNGGRVLGVLAVNHTLEQARERAYQAVGEITWAGEFHRTDIGQFGCQAD